jgi:serine protease Do/serine protease DegQ
MKTRFRFLVFGAALATALPPFLAAKDEKKPAASAPHPKPAVTVDPSPLTPQAGLVMSYADVVEPVQKAVVSIYSTKIVRERVTNPLFRQFFPNFPDQERESKEEGLGSGVIVTPDGYILTNNHVVEGADELKVSLSDDREFIAKVIGADPKTDIAVVKIDADKLPVVTLADSDKLRVGDVVFAVGNPLGVGQTVTMGIVSAKGRSVGILGDVGGYEDYIQTDAAINMGNSGGALIDAKGRLVGVNSAILSPSRGNIGIGFAVPVNLAASIMNSLVETGTVSRGYLGVSTDNVTPDVAEQLGLPKDTHGVVISDIIPGSAAEKAGLKRTDVILGVDGHAVSSLDELRLRIAQMAPGSTAKLKVVRDGKERIVDVTLDKFAEKPNELFAGINVKPLTAEDRRRLNIDARITGLLITDIDDDSPYADRLAPNSVIVELNRNPVPDLATAKQLLNQPGRNLLLIYTRAGLRYLPLTLK